MNLAEPPPKPRLTFLHFAPMLVAVVAVAIIRQLWWQYYIDFRGPAGWFGYPLVPVFCGLLVICLFPITYLIAFSISKTRSLLPTLILFVGGVVAFNLPLPPPPPTPEKLWFLENRAAYQAVIELARNGQLERAPYPRECIICFKLPEEYAHLALSGEVKVQYGYRWTVFFYPIELTHTLTFIGDTRGDLTSVCFDGYVEERIDAHWYVCESDWL